DRRRPSAGRFDGGGFDSARRRLSHLVFPLRGPAARRQAPDGEREPVRSRSVQPRRRRDGAYADRHSPPVGPPAARGPPRRGAATGATGRGAPAMEMTLALAIGVLTGSGVW